MCASQISDFGATRQPDLTPKRSGACRRFLRPLLIMRPTIVPAESPSPRRYALLQIFEPVEHHVDLLGRRRNGLTQSCRDDSYESSIGENVESPGSATRPEELSSWDRSRTRESKASLSVVTPTCPTAANINPPCKLPRVLGPLSALTVPQSRLAEPACDRSPRL
jgi:hypothetical protein